MKSTNRKECNFNIAKRYKSATRENRNCHIFACMSSFLPFFIPEKAKAAKSRGHPRNLATLQSYIILSKPLPNMNRRVPSRLTTTCFTVCQRSALNSERMPCCFCNAPMKSRKESALESRSVFFFVQLPVAGFQSLEPLGVLVITAVGIPLDSGSPWHCSRCVSWSIP